LQSFGSISIAAVAVSEEQGQISMGRDRSNAGHSDVVRDSERARKEQTTPTAASAASESALASGPVVYSRVPAAPLDDIALEHVKKLGRHLDDICLMKVDVEGASALPAFRSAKRLLASPRLQAVSFEYVPSDPGHTSELLHILSANGFRIFGNNGGSSFGPLEEREYRASEFESLTERLRQEGPLGTTLVAWRSAAEAKRERNGN